MTKMKSMTARVRHSHLQPVPIRTGGRSLLLVPAAASAQMGGVDALVTVASLSHSLISGFEQDAPSV